MPPVSQPQVAAPIPPSLSPPPQQQNGSGKTTRNIVIGIVVGFLVIFGGIIVVIGLWLGGTFTRAGDQSYGQAVAQLRDAKRNFTQSEAITFGDVDIKVLSVERTPFESPYSASRVGVAVTLEVRKNANPTYIATSVSDWAEAVEKITLNGSEPTDVKVSTKRIDMKELEAGPIEVTLKYWVPTADELTLEYTIDYFARVSGLVGTEGMPREYATYTIRLTNE